METQGFCHLSCMLSWIFAFLIPFVCSGIGAQSMLLENRVFVALAGEDLRIDFQLVKPANHSGGTLECFDPKNKSIHSSTVSKTDGLVETVRESVTLQKLEPHYSGQYHCEYQVARAYWVLLVRDEGYWEPSRMSEYRGVIIAGIAAFMLLVFNVVGSVYISKGHRDIVPLNTEHGSTVGRNEQNREESREEEDHKKTTAASTSFYASLETRPRSIYEVLDQSAANREAGQRKAKPKSKESKQMMEQTPPNQDEGVFESVYENF